MGAPSCSSWCQKTTQALEGGRTAVQGPKGGDNNMLTGTRSGPTYLTIGTAAMAALLLVACKKAVPPDGVCTYEPLPAGAQVPSGQGGIQVLASTDAYFAVRDTTGKQTASEHVNAITPVPPGDYQVVLNGSTHSTAGQSKK